VTHCPPIVRTRGNTGRQPDFVTLRQRGVTHVKKTDSSGGRQRKTQRRNGEPVRTEVSDGGSGLFLVCQPSGAKSWALRYRHDGRTRKLTLGPAIVLKPGEVEPGDVLTLAGARKRAADALHKLAQKIDPGLRVAKPPVPETFAAIAEACLAREAKRGLRSAERWLHDLRRLAFPAFGDQLMAGVRRGDVVRLLDRVEDKHGSVMADALLASVGKVMRWYAVRDESYVPPLVRGMRRSKPKERARSHILDDAELRKVWRAADAMPGPFGPFVQLALLTSARRNELARMQWSEISDSGVWVLPAARNKTKQDLSRPLSKAAQALLAKLPRFASCDFVFTFDGRKPSNAFTEQKAKLDQASGVTGWRIHDARRTARSLLARAGISSEVAGRCLGHAAGAMEHVYNRHGYEQEMRTAFEALAGLLERIVDPQPNVTALRR
jgi:integrase